jgi:hypothetical protein
MHRSSGSKHHLVNEEPLYNTGQVQYQYLPTQKTALPRHGGMKGKESMVDCRVRRRKDRPGQRVEAPLQYSWYELSEKVQNHLKKGNG